MKIFLTGGDNLGWALDNQQFNTKCQLELLGHTIVKNPVFADVVHTVCWNSVLRMRNFFLRYKKTIAVASNEIDTDTPEFKKASKIVNIWLAPSTRMQERLRDAGVDAHFQPIYANENNFFKIAESRENLCKEVGLTYQKIKDKLVIGSFQRDSLGADLSKPKWQKGPDILFEIVKKLPKEKIVLLLAGPRRHWIIARCKEAGIPYIYCGQEQSSFSYDDVTINTLPRERVNKFCNITDVYIISSKK
jgi:glycosyltransferase involved in cell wall biosynthesis